MNSRKFWIVLITVALVGATTTLLVLRSGIFRKKDLVTRIGTDRAYQPVAGEKFSPVEDWPQYRGPRGDGISREDVGESWPADAATSRLRWQASVGIGYASPVAVNGRVYLFSLHNGKDNLTCFDALTGNVIWSESSERGWTETYEGTRATPTVVGDAIYTFGGQGEVTCRELATGKRRWAQNAMEIAGAKPLQWGAASSPLVDDQRVYVQTGSNGSIAVALNAKTGELAWKSAATGKAGYAAPLLIDVGGTKQLIIFGGDTVYAMNPENGQTIWQQRWESNYGVAAATPVYRDGRLLVSTGYGKGSLFLNVSATSATKERETRHMSSKFPGMILDGDSLYGVTDAAAGRLACISWADGSLRWRADEDSLKLGFGGSIVKVPGDRLVALSEQGMLSLVAVSPQGARVISQFPAAVAEDKLAVWSTPLLYGGCVYVKGSRQLTCYKLR